ncbi:MAG: GH3 auxin-responsive promoter family protein [candidate division NC10 bacterium]|nr:GH3 auxin-responsive promoter family protein [candidate division NC10 bacterium]
MMLRAVGWFLHGYARHRRRALEETWRHAAAIQEATLLRLVKTARNTVYGQAHEFHRIRSVADYQRQVPVREYLDFRPLWQRALAGAHGITWPGRPRHWANTSGTTAGEKLIPVTPEALASHRKGGWDAFLLAAERVGPEHLLGGPMLFLGGTSALKPVGRGCLVGDLSGLVVRRLPPGLRGRYSPGPTIAAIPDWETRLTAVAAVAARQDLRLLSGMPSWILIFLERVASARHAAERPIRNLGECWPNLKVFIHGGVAFAPYRRIFEERIGRPLDFLEVYPASEGFVAVQTEATGGLTLMLDYGIFYEFIPVEDLGRDWPRRRTVADLKIGRSYAIAVTTPAGLWSYLLGDTVRFTARDPLRLEITGRTRHFVNAFGENVIVEEVERALVEASRRTGAEVVEFTVAPRYPTPAESRGGHDWLVEFRVPPRNRDDFARILDETLMGLNPDYRIKRSGNVGMTGPRLVEVPPGTFYRWMREAGKLGDQNKLPRVTNTRSVAVGVLTCAAASTREPLAAAGTHGRAQGVGPFEFQAG